MVASAAIVRRIRAEVNIAQLVPAQEAARQERERGLLRPLAGY
jgi:hypothetical protein